MKSKIELFNLGIPGITVMDRYIISELILPFLFGMGLFTSLGLAVGTLFDLVRKVTESGLLLNIAVKVLLLKMPEFVSLAFPMSILLASLMTYSRFSSDSEIIALRSIGVNIYRIILPGVILSLVITGVSFLFNNIVTPAANYEATITLEKALKDEQISFKERNIIYPEYNKIRQENGEKVTVLTRLFYAEEFNGKEMKGLTILDRSQAGLNQVLTSRSASWNISDNRWDFFDGTIYVIAPDGSYRNIVRFEHQQLDLPRTPLDLSKKGRDYNEMSIFQAQEYLEVVKLSGDDKKIRKLKVRIQEKFALPFVCLVFGLVGAAIGIKPQNTGKATSFGICILIIFSYYLLAFLSSNLGVSGVLTPVTSAWFPNLLGLIAGGLLLFRSASSS